MPSCSGSTRPDRVRVDRQRSELSRVSRDQHGVREFRFRYSLRARAGGYRESEAAAFGMSATRPLLAARGSLPDRPDTRSPSIRPGARHVPEAADEGAGVILSSGSRWRAEAISISVAGFTEPSSQISSSGSTKARVEGAASSPAPRARLLCYATDTVRIDCSQTGADGPCAAREAPAMRRVTSNALAVLSIALILRHCLGAPRLTFSHNDPR